MSNHHLEIGEICPIHRFQQVISRVGGKTMKKVLVAYFSLSGKTEMMAQYISEGVRISGQEAVMRKVSDIKSAEDLRGFDGYLLGSPTYHREMAGPMKTFLFLFRKVEVAGKPAGAFGSYTHDGKISREGHVCPVVRAVRRFVAGCASK